MPLCGHTGVALRGWLTSTSPPLRPRYPPDRYGSVLDELNSALNPRSVRWCVRRSYRQVDPLGFRPRQAHILQTQVKPQHLGSENRHSRDALRSAPLSPIPDRLSRAHPRQSTQKCLLLPVLSHPRQEPLFPPPNTCIAKLSVYTRL
jgi:hypothetical protein